MIAVQSLREKLECTVFGWTDVRTFRVAWRTCLDDGARALRLPELYAWDRTKILGLLAFSASIGGASLASQASGVCAKQIHGGTFHWPQDDTFR
jgi:hypothetical protein